MRAITQPRRVENTSPRGVRCRLRKRKRHLARAILCRKPDDEKIGVAQHPVRVVARARARVRTKKNRRKSIAAGKSERDFPSLHTAAAHVSPPSASSSHSHAARRARARARDFIHVRRAPAVVASVCTHRTPTRELSRASLDASRPTTEPARGCCVCLCGAKVLSMAKGLLGVWDFSWLARWFECVFLG